jgi:hypothetical protein
MTIENALKIKKFAAGWCGKVVAKRKDYREKLLSAIDDLLPDNNEYDPYDILNCKNWDDGEECYDEYSRRTNYHSCLSDRCRELIEWENIYGLTKKGQNDLICALRIATDLIIEASGGVVGYTVGDLKKVFDGTIPDWVDKLYKGNLNRAKDTEGVWL